MCSMQGIRYHVDCLLSATPKELFFEASCRSSLGYNVFSSICRHNGSQKEFDSLQISGAVSVLGRLLHIIM